MLFRSWLIASDHKATWYQVALGTDGLYNYMIIGPDGNVVSSGKAGNFYTSGPDKDTFRLAADLDNYVGRAGAATILPKDKTYHERLKSARRAAELRQFAVAWRLCGKGSGKEAAASAAELRNDLTDWANRRVGALSAVLADEQATSETKLDAYLELKQIADGLPATAPGKNARKAVAQAARDKAVAAEIRARREYMTLMAKAAGSSEKLVKNPGFSAALKTLARKHSDTRYGRMAAADAVRIDG